MPVPTPVFAVLTDQEFRRAVGCAVRAPSLHNTQPWSFARHADEVHVRADRSRWLRQTDPLAREMLISCGGAVRHLVLGLRHQGLDVQVALHPEPLLDPDLVAVVTTVGRRPITLSESALYAAVGLRHTDRSRFAALTVPSDVLEQLRLLAEAEGCFLTALDEHGSLALAALTTRADQFLNDQPAVREEQARWITDEHRPAEGLPAQALPDHAVHRGSPVPLRDFDPVEASPDGEPPVVEHPLLVVLGTDTDDIDAWVRCGWALSSVLLTLTDHRLVASPMTQAFEVYGLRSALRHDLGLVGYPQLALRIGYPGGFGSPRTGRRPVRDVLRTDSQSP